MEDEESVASQSILRTCPQQGADHHQGAEGLLRTLSFGPLKQAIREQEESSDEDLKEQPKDEEALDDADIGDGELVESPQRGAVKQKRWWHVPDDCIKELISQTEKGLNEEEDRESSCSPTNQRWKRKDPKPIKEALAHLQDKSNAAAEKAEVSPKVSPEDALDQMLRRMASTETKIKTAEDDAAMEDIFRKYGDADDEYSGDHKTQLRPRRWWHVPTNRIKELIEERQAESRERESFPTSPASTQSPSSPSKLQRTKTQGIHVRLATLARSDPVPCPHTGRRHRALPLDDLRIQVYFKLVDTDCRFHLLVEPELRIGPDQPPPANRFTEKFGRGACTNGFADKAQTFDYRYRRWANNPRPDWVPRWTDSLKLRIEQTSGIEIWRQQLMMHNCTVGSDSSTVRTCGITPGVEINIFVKKKEESKRDPRNITLASTAKLRQSEETKQELAEARQTIQAALAASASAPSLLSHSLSSTTSLGESPSSSRTLAKSLPLPESSGSLCMMPPWQNPSECPRLFGGKDEKGGGLAVNSLVKTVPPFSEVSIFRADLQDQRLQRIRSLPTYTTQAARW